MMVKFLSMLISNINNYNYLRRILL